MSFITRGYTLTDGKLGDYNYTTLHALVDAAAVTAIAMGEFATTSKLVQVSATTPVSDQGDGSLWYDSALGCLREKNGNARWDCPYAGPEMQNNALVMPKGALVAVSAAGVVASCATGMWSDALGFLASTCVSGANALVQSRGPGFMLVFGPVTMGDTLVSYLGGYARSLHATGLSTATMGVPVGQCWASLASGATGLCLGNISR